MTKLKKISWQAIMIVGLVFTIITSIILGLSGAWFQGKDGAGTEGKLGHAVVVRLKDVETNDNVRGWEEIYDSTKTQAYPGDTLIGSTQIQMASTSPALIRVQVEPIVQATSDGGANYVKVTYTDADVPVALDGVDTPENMADETTVAKYYNKLISLKPKRSTYTDEAAYRQDYLAYYDKAYAWNNFIFRNLTDELKLSTTDWNKKSGWWYFNKIYGDTTKPSELKTGTLPLFNKLVLSPYLTDEVAQWKVSIILKVEAIQAAHRDDPTHPWYDDIKDMPFDGSYVEETDELQTLSLSDFNYEVVDEGTEGTFSEADGDYIKLLSVKKNVAKFEVKSHYSIYTDDKTPAPETSTESSTTSATNGGARLASRSLKVLADDREIASLPVRFIGGSGLFANAKSVVLPDTVDWIGNEAFKDSDIEDISIKDSTTGEVLPVLSNGSVSEAPKAKDWMDGVYIGNEAFVGTDIDNVTIPTGVDFTINENAFDPDTKYTYDGKTYDNLEDLKDAMGDRLTIDHSALYTPAVGSGGSGRPITFYDPAGANTYELSGKGSFTYDIVDGDIVIRTFAPSDTTNGVTDLEIPSAIEGKVVVKVNSQNSTKGNKPNYEFIQNKALLKGTLTIPESVKDVGESFRRTGISTLIIKGSELNGQFSNCDNLNNVVADNLNEISRSLFYDCSNLKQVNLDNVIKVDNSAFSYCKSLETVTMPKLNNIGMAAFDKCTALKRFNSNIDGIFDLHNITTIESAVYDWSGAFEDCTSVEKVYFGQNVYIGARAFKNCSNLKNIYFVDDNGASSQSGLRTLAATSGDIDASNYADDTASASYITTATYKSDLNKDSYKYAVSTNAGKILVNDTEVTELEPGTYNLTIDTTNCGYIHSISYSVPTTSGAETQTISVDGYPTQHTITNFVFTRGVSFDVANYYKLTDENGKISYVKDYKKSPENYNDEANTIDYYSYSFGANPYDVTRTKGTKKAYKVTYVDDGQTLQDDKIYEYNNYIITLPTYGFKNGRKWIAGWRDNNGYEYLFTKKFAQNGGVDVTTETVQIINPTGDITLTPIWSTDDGPLMTFNGGPNKVRFSVDGLFYTYNGFVLPKIYAFSGYWWDYEHNVGYMADMREDSSGLSCRQYVGIDDNASAYNFEAQVDIGSVWTDGIDNLIGYNGKAYGAKLTFDTGWKEVDSPTSTKEVGDRYGLDSYTLPILEANERYEFLGWKCDVAVEDDSRIEKPAGRLIMAGSSIHTIKDANWTAVWFNLDGVKFDTGWKYDNSPTNDKNARIEELSGYFSSQFYCLPSLVPNNGFVFKGWKCSIAVKVGSTSASETAAGELIPGGRDIYTLENAEWTAVWEDNTSIANMPIDTGWREVDSPTTTKTANVIYTAGSDSYQLPSAPVANTGFIFKGWKCNIKVTVRYASGSYEYEAGTLIEAGTRIYTLEPAIWTAEWFDYSGVLATTVDTGYSIGATSTETASVKYTVDNIFYILPSAPTANEGYVFRGWICDIAVKVGSSDETETPAGELIAAGRYIYTLNRANWTAVWFNKNAITFDTGYPDATSTETVNVIYSAGDSYYRLPSAPSANEGYVFRGWICDIAVKVDSSSAEETPAGELVSNWSDIYTLETAHWTAVWVKININTGYSIGATSTETANIIYNVGYDYYMLPSELEANNGYVFLGWKCDIAVKVGSSDAEETPAGELIKSRYYCYIYTLEHANWTAVWFSVKNDVTFDTGYSTGATNDTTAEITNWDSSAYCLPAAPTANSGWSFVGWTKDGGTTVESAGSWIYDLTKTAWTAVWKELGAGLSITVDTGYSRGATDTQTASVNFASEDYYELPGELTGNAGWTFIGWKCNINVVEGWSSNSETNAGKVIRAGSSIYTMTDATWTAVWLKVTLVSGNDVAYSGDMGSIDYSSGNDSFTLSKIPTDTGYVHMGWTCDKDIDVDGKFINDNGEESWGRHIAAAGTQIANNARVYSFDEYTFTAVWAKGPNSYNITFDLDGKSDDEGLAISYSDGDSYYELPAVQTTKDNYIFIGWSCNIDLTIDGEVVSKDTVIDMFMGDPSIETFADCVYTAHYVKATLNTGYLSENSPTPNETANLEFEQMSAAAWPKLPKLEANAGWAFKGWRLDTDVPMLGLDVTAQSEEDAYIFLKKDGIMPIGEMIFYLCANMEEQKMEWADHTWTAVWEKAPTEYVIAIEAGDHNATESPAIVYTSGDAYYSLPQLTSNDGYIVVGWKCSIDVVVEKINSEVTTAGTTIAYSGTELKVFTFGNCTWTAVWDKLSKYTITISGGDNCATQNPVIIYTEGNYYYELPLLKGNNCIIAGWKCSIDVVVYNDYNEEMFTVSAGEALYLRDNSDYPNLIYTFADAVWTPIWKNISFELGEGADGELTEIVYYQENDSRYDLPQAPAAKDGYTFRYWRDENGNIGYAGNTFNGSNDRVWTAVWEKADA